MKLVTLRKLQKANLKIKNIFMKTKIKLKKILTKINRIIKLSMDNKLNMIQKIFQMREKPNKKMTELFKKEPIQIKLRI